MKHYETLNGCKVWIKISIRGKQLSQVMEFSIPPNTTIMESLHLSLNVHYFINFTHKYPEMFGLAPTCSVNVLAEMTSSTDIKTSERGPDVMHE